MHYITTSVLNKSFGGRTKSILRRAQLLDQVHQIPTTIVTTNYNIHYPEIYDDYLKQNLTTQKIHYDNLYDYLSGYTLFKPIYKRFRKEPVMIETPTDVSGYIVKQDKKKANVYRYYKDDVYCFYRQYYPDTNILKFEDTMSVHATKKIERKEYNTFGYLHRVTNFHPITFQKLHQTFYTPTGYMYLKIFYEQDKIALIIHYHENGTIKQSYSKEKEMFIDYFNARFKSGDVVFNDARLLDWSLSKVRRDIKKYHVLHSAHVMDGVTKKSFKFVLENANLFDGYIVLTQAQKLDIIQSFSIPEEKVIYIPHGEPAINDFEHLRIPNQICYVGRYEKEKRIEDMINALALVKAKGNKFQFLMYGMGDTEYMNELKKLIVKKQLDESISINTFTSTPKAIFAESMMSLNTSKYEGFGLSIMESINQHCPVISYDIKYGPNELIIDDVNGYLVEEGNIEQLSEAIIKALNHPLYKTTYLNEKFTEENMINAYAKIIL